MSEFDNFEASIGEIHINLVFEKKIPSFWVLIILLDDIFLSRIGKLSRSSLSLFLPSLYPPSIGRRGLGIDGNFAAFVSFLS